MHLQKRGFFSLYLVILILTAVSGCKNPSSGNIQHSADDILYIPDTKFKNYLVGNTDINTNQDDEIQYSEAWAFTGRIKVWEKDICNFTGIEAFTALTQLDNGKNNLENLDVSANIKLTYLGCSGNVNLGSLDISANTELRDLACNLNNLNSLNLHTNTKLRYLDCCGNNLKSLDLSANTALRHLDCRYNDLVTLNLSGNTALRRLDCRDNDLVTLDLSANTALEDLDCRYNNLVTLDVSTIEDLQILNCRNNTSLTTIYVRAEQITPHPPAYWRKPASAEYQVR